MMIGIKGKMSESTILESLKVYRDYLNGDSSHVEVVEVPLPDNPINAR